VGDWNKKIFHNKSHSRLIKNKVVVITLEDGSRLTEFANIKKVSQAHFVDLYSQRDEAEIGNVNSML